MFTACYELRSVGPRPFGRGIVVQISEACREVLYSDSFWADLKSYNPPLVLLAMASDEPSLDGMLQGFNGKMPIMWLSAADGAALVSALSQPNNTDLQLVNVLGAIAAPILEGYAKQPADTSRVGPAFDLAVKPDIAAPGALYSSLTDASYQTWLGTSMAAPYVAGVIALWMQQQRLSGVVKPSAGWPSAAFTALKNTAKPLPFPGASGLMWPPAKVGAGVVQALHAVLNRVTIFPNELLLRTDVQQQSLTVTLRNPTSTAVTYAVSHAPAVTIAVDKAWYRLPYDLDAPTADVDLSSTSVTVPPAGSVQVRVTISIGQDLQAMDAIISGYILFQPSSPTPIPGGSTSNNSVNNSTNNGNKPKKGSKIKQGGLKPSSTLITLSLPYQGTTKDYSSFGTSNSLALFASPVPDLGPVAAALLAGSMSICLSFNQGTSLECINNNQESGLVRVPRSYLQDGALGFTVAVVRPFQELTIQVWSGNGLRYLGVSPKYGPCSASKPYEVTILPSQLCTDNPKWNGQYRNSSGVMQSLQVNTVYTFRLAFRPFLAAADRASGRGPLADVFASPVKGRVRILAG
eukprot:gene12451-12588_t